MGAAALALSLTGCGPDPVVETWCGDYEEQMGALVDQARNYSSDSATFHSSLPAAQQRLVDLRDAAPNDRLGHALDSTLSEWAVLNFDAAGIANVLDLIGFNGDPVVIACDKQGVDIG